MDLIDKLRETSLRIPAQIEHIGTEEATKNAFVLPFINALGYNVFDPTEVVPEFTADVGIKKGEKVDYAILKDKRPIILFECKWHGRDLDKEHASQLFRYFSTTRVRFCVLTNGIIYKFYSDLDEPNVMDSKPFFEFNMLDIKEPSVMELKKFSKSSFELDSLLTTASELKYMGEIRRVLEEQMVNPSDEFVRFFASQVYRGRITQPIIELFTRLTKNTYRQFISDKINDRLKSALAGEDYQPLGEINQSQELKSTEKQDDRIITTEEEIDGYNSVKAILAETVDPDRVFIRDTLKYCGVVLDDSNRKPICRMYFNGSNKYIGLFNEDKKEEKIEISSIKDINNYSDRLKAIAMFYKAQTPEPEDKNRAVFTFKGQRYEAKYWKDMYSQIINIMAKEHGDQIEKILTLSGRKNLLFSKNPGDLRSSAKVEGTDIYAEVGFGAGYLIKLAKRVISLFGYSEEDLAADYS
ncbi:MAG: type I restriction enzyme HsdR N-terminal domain-containing protein [Methanotrichaceae archaeon]|nr:type I restriction enzyme HsdR N-terminal domain-containing protein [Methanotrichaceae archaeon]